MFTGGKYGAIGEERKKKMTILNNIENLNSLQNYNQSSVNQFVNNKSENNFVLNEDDFDDCGNNLFDSLDKERFENSRLFCENTAKSDDNGNSNFNFFSIASAFRF